MAGPVTFGGGFAQGLTGGLGAANQLRRTGIMEEEAERRREEDQINAERLKRDASQKAINGLLNMIKEDPRVLATPGLEPILQRIVELDPEQGPFISKLLQAAIGWEQAATD